MQNTQKKLLNKSLIFKSVIVFLSAYLISLFLWIQIKDSYGYVLTSVASKFVGKLKDLKVDNIREGKDTVFVSFSRSMRQGDIVIDLAFKTSSYTYNVPLTFSIMASLCIFITRRRRAYAEASLLLLFVHFIYVFFLGAEQSTVMLIERDIEVMSKARLFVYQLVWVFTDSLLLRCEPFLIGFYMYIRYRKDNSVSPVLLKP